MALLGFGIVLLEKGMNDMASRLFSVSFTVLICKWIG